jgi:glycosyltransferase involved in cell wall biosynthesis
MQEYLLKRLPPQYQHSIHFYGHVHHEILNQALIEARVAVFPSYTETFGLGPVEAMACACPTIFTKLTCGPEIVREEIDGLLVDPDQPSQVAQAILAILRDESLAKRLSEAGRERVVKTYTLDTLIPANEAFFAQVVRSFGERK